MIEREFNILDAANEVVVKTEDDWIYETHLEHKRLKKRAEACRLHCCRRDFQKVDDEMSDEATRLNFPPEMDHEQQRDYDKAMNTIKGLTQQRGINGEKGL